MTKNLTENNIEYNCQIPKDYLNHIRNYFPGKKKIAEKWKDSENVSFLTIDVRPRNIKPACLDQPYTVSKAQRKNSKYEKLDI